jgi:hypothetical protein
LGFRFSRIGGVRFCKVLTYYIYFSLSGDGRWLVGLFVWGALFVPGLVWWVVLCLACCVWGYWGKSGSNLADKAFSRVFVLLGAFESKFGAYFEKVK